MLCDAGAEESFPGPGTYTVQYLDIRPQGLYAPLKFHYGMRLLESCGWPEEGLKFFLSGSGLNCLHHMGAVLKYVRLPS
jgi:hypothetical protein